MKTNMEPKEVAKLGWALSVEVRERFTDFCKSVGAIAQDDCAGALIVWTHLPPEIREWAKLEAKGTPVMPEQFWEDFCAGFRLGLRGQQESQGKKPK